MNREMISYFIIIVISAIAITIAGLRLLTYEVDRGRHLGKAYLQLQAEHIATSIKNNERNILNTTNGTIKVLHFIGNDPSMPQDGRCFGIAAFGPTPEETVRTCWPGESNPGLARSQRFSRAETALRLFFLIALFSGLVLLACAAIREHRKSASYRKRVAELSHRLRTPLTALSICAELLDSDKLDDTKRRQAISTIHDRSRLLSERLDELITFHRGK